MPADPTIQNALIVIAAALVVQTLLMVCTVVAMAIAWKRAQAMIDAQLGHFSTRLDDVVAQTRMAVGAIERSAAQVDTVFHDAGHILRTVTTAVAVPRALVDGRRRIGGVSLRPLASNATATATAVRGGAPGSEATHSLGGGTHVPARKTTMPDLPPASSPGPSSAPGSLFCWLRSPARRCAMSSASRGCHFVMPSHAAIAIWPNAPAWSSRIFRSA